jgi:hypothetical protein
MASDGNSGQTPITSLVHGSQAPVSVSIQKQSGKSLPPGGKEGVAAAAGGAVPAERPTVHLPAASSPVLSREHPRPVARPAPQAPAAAGNSSAQSLAAALNKHLNDSGRPDEFRVAPQSDDKIIQQVNPATGEVIGEFYASEFPALARSVGASGVLIDSHA